MGVSDVPVLIFQIPFCSVCIKGFLITKSVVGFETNVFITKLACKKNLIKLFKNENIEKASTFKLYFKVK